MNLIGYVVGESTTSTAIFVSSFVPRVGQYVQLSYDGRTVLGMIQGLISGSRTITDSISDAEVVRRIKELEAGKDRYIKGTIRLLGDVNRLELPRVPPPPGTEVYEADAGVLTRLFNGDIRIGVLASNPEVPVHVDVNRMVSRHLAILAVTGAGKSNTVAVIVSRLVQRFRRATVVIFDMHSEYIDMRLPDRRRVNVIRPTLNPAEMNLGEMLRLLNIDAKAYVQERYFRRAYHEVREEVAKEETPKEKFLKRVREVLEVYREKYSRDRGSIDGVLNKIDDFEDRYRGVINYHFPMPADLIRDGCVNIIDLGTCDEEVADVVASHVLREALERRKAHRRQGPLSGNMRTPVLMVLEEAHILAPKGRGTLSKYWIGRVAREGRKFGVGLCLVSQRPKALDIDALSQVNNMIVLRLVEPNDQHYVQQASEALSEDLLQQLPSLNVGEAVVLGMMIRMPAIVKIDKFEGTLGGQDIDIAREWSGEEEVMEDLSLLEDA